MATQIQAATRLRASPSPAKLLASLRVVNTWLNTTQRPSYGVKLEKAVGVLVQELGYEPYGGRVFRAFRTQACPKVGATIETSSGLSAIQSWSETEEGATSFLAYLGNEDNRVVVELLSPALEIMNSQWLRRVVAPRLAALGPAFAAETKELRVILGKRDSADDEKEVTLKLPPAVKVRVLKFYPSYKT